MKTMTQIIDETAETYTSETRAVVEGTNQCLYQTSKGYRCAVGRCMEDPLFVDNNFAENEDSSVGTLSENYDFDDFLKPKYRGHPIRFWTDLQGLHDDSRHWDQNGLSDRGRAKVEHLKNKWGGLL